MKAVVQHCYGPPDALAELIESGKVTSVIDWTYPLAEVPRPSAVSGRDTPGKIVITV